MVQPDISSAPTSKMRFCHPWRPYQARVIEAIQHHLEDKKLHLIAPPGSGKTVLGLEIFRMLAKPALVLAPTRIIRDQWVLKLKDFLPGEATEALTWTSRDLSELGFFTAVTYQALHQVFGESKKSVSEGNRPPSTKAMNALLKKIKEGGVQTLILDESHHLKAAWWDSLSKLVEKVDGLVLVSLTATPPVDVKEFQWQKYLDLCGPIDEEISVPELVKAGTLCPHQDFIWAVPLPTQKQKSLREFTNVVEVFLQDMDADLIFFESLLEHPWRAESEKPALKNMLALPELTHAILIYWRAKEMAFPRYIEKWLGKEMSRLPSLSAKWWQVLLAGYLFWADWPHTSASAKHRDQLAQQMRAKGLLHQREIRLLEAKPIKRMLSLSAAKMDACVAVYQLEREVRGSDLRIVFLTDYIRDEIDVGSEDPEDASLGAWPLFYRLSVNMPLKQQRQLALLTGRLCIFHQSLVTHLEAVYPKSVEVQPLVENPEFVKWQAPTGLATTIFTQWLADGTLQALVGTRALLGEGWDAPCINALVLASFVGSFVTTNQMRGRAIRVNTDRLDKWASIWHLVAVAENSDLGMLDFQDLERRFHTFVGLGGSSFDLENSLDRLQLPYFSRGVFQRDRINIEESNRLMTERLLRGSQLRERWQKAIGSGEMGRVVPAIQTDEPPNLIRAYMSRKKLSKVILLGAMLTAGGLWWIWNAAWFKESAAKPIVFLAGGLALIALPLWLRSLKRLARLATRTGLLRAMAMALRDALCESGHLSGAPDQYSIQCGEDEKKGVFAALAGGDFYEQSLFADSLEILVKPPNNPRYLLRMKGLAWLQSGNQSCCSVPKILAVKKPLALLFHKHMEKRVSKAELIYTRLENGRQLLLKTQLQAMLAASDEHVHRLDRWM